MAHGLLPLLLCVDTKERDLFLLCKVGARVEREGSGGEVNAIQK
jgi:hypothetical protein